MVRRLRRAKSWASGLASARLKFAKTCHISAKFGKQGTGYEIKKLVDQLRRILKVEREWDVALVGAGAIGHALAHYNGFIDRGFRISIIFDNDPHKIGTPPQRL